MDEEYLEIEKISDHQTLILDQKSRRLMIRKTVSNGEEPVYQWLISHPDPHLVRIYSCKRDKDKLVVDEEAITGMNLQEYLKQKKPDQNEKKRIYLEILDGVEILHHASPPIIHRDIKASNIMISEEGKAVIIDFDAAKTFKGQRSRDTVLIGTEGSAAPEQYGFAESDERTDIYALGILAKEMFPEKTDFIRKSTAMDPENRFQNIHQMRKGFLSGRTPYSWIPFDPYKRSSIIGFLLMMLLLVWLTWITDYHGESAVRVWKDRFVEFMIFLTLYMLYHRWTPLFRGITWLQDDRMIVMVCGYVFMTIAIFFFWALTATLIE